MTPHYYLPALPFFEMFHSVLVLSLYSIVPVKLEKLVSTTDRYACIAINNP